MSNLPMGSLKKAYDVTRTSLSGKGWTAKIKTRSEDQDGVSADTLIPSTNLTNILSFESGLKGVTINLYRYEVRKNDRKELIDHVFIQLENWRGENELNLYIGAPNVDLCKKIGAIFERELHLKRKPEPPKHHDNNLQLLHERAEPKASSNTSHTVTQPNSYPEEKPKLQYPDKITLNWLREHAPLSFWKWPLIALFTAFTLGLKLGEYKWVTHVWNRIWPF
ncbi:MAG: hypothetical protein H7A51_15895 [Akkermansiaceae bacterium]|nr:hypothetical protein [Akkermansiaceae bacterium]